MNEFERMQKEVDEDLDKVFSPENMAKAWKLHYQLRPSMKDLLEPFTI